MNKAQFKTALEAKHDKVGDFKGGYPEKLGMVRYDIEIFSEGTPPATHTIFVENDGKAGEAVRFGGEDPTIADATPQPDFTQKVDAEIEARKEAGTILDAYVDRMTFGKTVTEVVAYRDNAGSIVKERYIVHEKSDGKLIFRQLS